MARFSLYSQLSSVLVICLVGFAGSDVASDRSECADQLVGLMTCLPYAQGLARSPTPACCGGLKQVVAQSKKCLCVLVRDRDDPNLGIKFNATLALNLPASCGVPLNASECIDLLHLAPNSTEAQVFKQFGSVLEGKNSTTAAAGVQGNSPSSSAAVKSYGASDKGGKRWALREMVLDVWIWCSIPLMNILVGLM